ncbi:MAG: peptidoglycan-binding protein [candidate division Zixibacteria bacterium]|nr:peptidoglycan-binding protein [candidate division Zixibacteria bacterium]
MKTNKSFKKSLILIITIVLMIATQALAIDLKVGDKGSDVKKVQDRLNELGYDAGLADGIFGRKTRTAVKQFQLDHNLSPTGAVNDKTFNAIMSAEVQRKAEDFDTGDEFEDFDDFEFEDFSQSSTEFEYGGYIKTANAIKFANSDWRYPTYIADANGNILAGDSVKNTPRTVLQQNALHLDLKGYFPNNYSSKVSVDLYYSTEPDKPYHDQFEWEIDEAYITHSGEKLSITAGKEKIAWGVIDGISPFNIINSFDMMDPFVNGGLEDAQGQWQIRFNYDEIGKYRFEALFIPVWTPSKIPNAELLNNGEMKADYWVPPIFTSIPQLIYNFDAVQYYDDFGQLQTIDLVMFTDFDGMEKPKKDLKSAAFGARVTMPYKDWDLGGYLISSLSPTPSPIIDVQMEQVRIDFGSFQRDALALLTRIQQQHSRIFAIGMSADKIFGRLRFKGEAAVTYGNKYFPDITNPEGITMLFTNVLQAQANYQTYREYGKKYSTIYFIVGGEYTIPDVDIITSAQLSYSTNTGYEEAYFGNEENIKMTLFAMKSYMDNQLTASMVSMIDFNGSAVFLTPKAKFVPTYMQFLEITAGANLFLSGGAEQVGYFKSYDSILGSYQKYSHAFGTVKFIF